VDGPGQRTERIEHRARVLVSSAPNTSRSGSAQERRQRVREGARRVRIVRPVHVDVPELLEPRRPARGPKPFLGVPRLAQPARFQKSAGEGGVAALVVPGQGWLRPHVPCGPP